MAKTANLYANIKPKLKKQAEQISNALGLPPYRKPLEISSMTKDELNMELEKGYQDVLEGRTKPINEVFESLNNEYGI